MPDPAKAGVAIRERGTKAFGASDELTTPDANFDGNHPRAGAAKGPDRASTVPVVIRGGTWVFGAESARCGLRYTHRRRDRGPSLGFRLAHDVPARE